MAGAVFRPVDRGLVAGDVPMSDGLVIALGIVLGVPMGLYGALVVTLLRGGR